MGIGMACYVEGTGVGPYEGGALPVETSGEVVVSTGLTTAGPGSPGRVRADRRPTSSGSRHGVEVITGDTRRFSTRWAPSPRDRPS